MRSTAGAWVETLLLCAIFVVFARTFVAQPSEVPTGSMEDTVLPGDLVLLNRFLYAPLSFGWERALLPVREIRRGDIVVFGHPERPEQPYLKRVIGLPGETIELRGGLVHVGGRPLAEPYVNRLYRIDEDLGPLEIPADSLFVMGDHRNRSSDSRAWGSVPRALVGGRAVLVIVSARSAERRADSPTGAASPARKLYDLLVHPRWDRTLRPVQ